MTEKKHAELNMGDMTSILGSGMNQPTGVLRSGSDFTKHQSTRAERKARRKIQKASRKANRC